MSSPSMVCNRIRLGQEIMQGSKRVLLQKKSYNYYGLSNCEIKTVWSLGTTQSVDFVCSANLILGLTYISGNKYLKLVRRKLNDIS